MKDVDGRTSSLSLACVGVLGRVVVTVSQSVSPSVRQSVMVTSLGWFGKFGRPCTM